MDQAPLVDSDIVAGKAFVELLRKAKGLRMEAAFWWQEDDEWRFIVASPIVHERGRVPAYQKIHDALGSRD